MWQLFIVTFLDWWEIQFDQVWSILDGSDPKKSKNKTAIFLLFKNVTTLYTNIFWYGQPLRRVFFCRKTLTQTDRQCRSNSSLDCCLPGGYSAQAIRECIDFLMCYRFFVNSSFDLLYLEGFRGIGDYCASLHVRRPKSLKLWSNKQYDCILVQQGCTWPKNCFDIKCCKAAIIFIPPISLMYHCTVFYSNIKLRS